MAGQVTQSKFAARFKAGGAAVHNAEKDKPAEVGNSRLPPGIDNGIARLRVCRIEPMKSGKHVGEDCFKTAGVALSPKTHTYKDDNGNTVGPVPVEGQPIRPMSIPLCDTPEKANKKRWQDHYAEMLNTLKLFAGEDSVAAIAGTPEQIFNGIVKLCKDLESEQPTVTFRTWKGKKRKKGESGYDEKYDGPNAPEKIVNEEWGQRCEYDADADAGGGVEAEGDPALNGQQQHEEVPTDEAPQDDASVGDETSALPEDLNELAALADSDLEATLDDNGDGPPAALAGAKLTELATAAGIDDEERGALNTWQEVADLIAERQAASDAPAEPEPEPEKPWEPAKGELYGHRVIDPKTKKPAIDPKTKKPRQVVKGCEVVSVDKKTKTVTLLNGIDKKTKYAGVRFDALIRE